MTCRDELPAASSGTYTKELRAASLVRRVDNLRTIRRPVCRCFNASVASQAPCPTASCAVDVEFWIAVLAQGARNLAAIGRKGCARIRAGKLYDPAARTRAKIDQVDVRVAALIAGIGEFAAVGSESRRDAYRIVVRQLTHIGSVIVRRINFLTSTPGGDEGDAGAGNSFVAS